MNIDFMKMAIEEADKASGMVHPNPFVGAVIVKDGKVIAKGYHHQCGDLHAERDALKNAREAGIDVKGAEMYVTLEPCCHHGKQPPCTEAVIKAGIKKIYIGSRDPNNLVNGKGIQQLKDAGIETICDVLKDECDRLNPAFFHFIQHKTPYITIKTAVTLDGKTSLEDGRSKWITGEQSRQYVQFLRNKSSAVMAGINTVLKDNPMLNIRNMDSSYQCKRIVLDTSLRIPENCNLVLSAKESPVIVFCGPDADSEKAGRLKELGVNVITTEISGSRLNLKTILNTLGGMNISSILVESGGILSGALMEEGLVNRLCLFTAPKIFLGTGRNWITGKEVESIEKCIKLTPVRSMMLGDDMLTEYEVNNVYGNN